MLLEGKVAIITGSTSGIGEAAAYTLAGQGAKVLVTGREGAQGEAVVAAIQDNGGEAALVVADLLDPDSPSVIVEETVGRWGRLDILVNNAAMVCNKPVVELTHPDWDRLFTVNLKAPFFMVQTALPYLRASRGCVVNVSSINGQRNDYNNLVYDTMKAGLNHMTSGLALDFRKEGLRFNAILPGGVATPLLDIWLEQSMDSVEAKRVATEIKKDPSVAHPQQIADAILFLVSDMANWVNGAAIPLDGGFSLGYS